MNRVAEPAHPVPAALLAKLRDKSRPFSLREMRRTYDLRRDAFLQAEDAKVPGTAKRQKDRLYDLAQSTALLLAFWFTVQVVFLRENARRGDAGWFVIAAFGCLMLGVLFAVPLV
jgi:hypothetical protein